VGQPATKREGTFVNSCLSKLQCAVQIGLNFEDITQTKVDCKKQSIQNIQQQQEC